MSSEAFWLSARREAEEETGLSAPPLHPWHQNADRPFLIDSHAVPGKASRGERPHLHHDLQFLFVADPASPLVAQLEEVSAARWHGIAALECHAKRSQKAETARPCEINLSDRSCRH